MPGRFSEERDDRLMNSLIDKYAREVKDNDDKLTGKLFCNKEDALAVSKEVVATHMDGISAAQFLSGGDSAGDEEPVNRFEDTWNHFDVNHDGLVEVERMPQFLRYLLGNALEINLQ